MKFHVKDLDLAKKYSINPVGMVGIRRVFETVSRFVGYDYEDINAALVEYSYFHNFNNPPTYTYKEIPYDMKKLLFGILDKNGTIKNFLDIPDIEEKFIRGFIKNRHQPNDFLFQGVITFKNLIRGKSENVPTEIEYDSDTSKSQKN